MHAIERAEYILSMLEKNKVVMVTDLSREMGVTEETVRKDLEKLEKQEKLNRVHGGAYLNEGFGNETPISVRNAAVSGVCPYYNILLLRNGKEWTFLPSRIC